MSMRDVCACSYCACHLRLAQGTCFRRWLSLAPWRLRSERFFFGVVVDDLDFPLYGIFGPAFHHGGDLDDFVRFEEGG